MEASFQLNYCMRGYHIYKKVWQSNTMEILSCKKEVNIHDPYAVCMVNETGITVGHVPRKISAVCYMLIQRGGSISCQVTGSRRYSYDLPQGGLELPCCLTFTGPSKIVEKVQKLLDKQPALMEDFKKTDSEPLNKEPKIADNHNSLQDMAQLSENETWVTYQSHKLSNIDKATIKNGERLTNKHITFCQTMLKTIFINRRFRMYTINRNNGTEKFILGFK